MYRNNLSYVLFPYIGFESVPKGLKIKCLFKKTVSVSVSPLITVVTVEL